MWLPVVAGFLSMLSCIAHAEDRALLIGINGYQNATALKGTHNDVQSMHHLLTIQLGFKPDAIKVLKDDEATRNGILQAMDEWLVQGSKSGDHVVFYYSGHGSQSKYDDDHDEDDHRDEAIIAYDGKADESNWVIDDEIAARISQLDDRFVLAVFDSCHSGSVTRGVFDADEGGKTPNWHTRGADFTPDLTHQKEGGFIKGSGNTVAFFAVAPNQLAIDDSNSNPDHPHGVFTDAFIRGMQGAADKNNDGLVSFAELLKYSQAQSKVYCDTIKKGCGREPLLPMLESDNRHLGDDVRHFTRASVAPVPVASSTPPLASQAGNVIVLDNSAQLALTIEPSPRIPLGKPIKFTLNTPRKGKLMLFDIGTSNKITPLFPNSYQSQDTLGSCRKSGIDGLVQANTRIVLPDQSCMPFKFIAQEPIGKGSVLAVLAEDESVDIQDLISQFSKSSFTNIGQPQQWLNQLSARQNVVIHQADGSNRAGRWSMVKVDYEITR